MYKLLAFLYLNKEIECVHLEHSISQVPGE